MEWEKMSAPWNSPEREVTPESALASRRGWLKWVGLGGVALATGVGLWWWRYGGADDEILPRSRTNLNLGHLFPAHPHPQFTAADRPLTLEAQAARYCNFYEFARGKNVWRYVEPFQPLPWSVQVGGLVVRPRT